MKLFKRYVIAEYQRGLVINEGSLERILEPGVYRIFNPFGRIEVKLYDITQESFDYPQFDVLAERHPQLVERYFQVTELKDNEVGLVYRKDVLSDVLAPGSRLIYWNSPVDIRVELINLDEGFELSADKAKMLARIRNVTLARKLSNFLYISEVADEFLGLLIVDGKLTQTLTAGLYVFWTFNRSIKVEQVDTRVQSMEVSGQEILSSDKVTLRINLSAAYQVSDPVKARSAFKDWNDYLYRELQFGLRQAIAVRSLDELLSDKGVLDQEVYRYVREKVTEQGIEVRNVGIKDVILPGDMKDILNQVVEAEKASQANIIKRREETAATRSLLNTARLMDQNPTLLRLKELEVLEKVTEKVDRMTVFGGLEGVLKDTVRINV